MPGAIGQIFNLSCYCHFRLNMMLKDDVPFTALRIAQELILKSLTF